MPLLAEFNRAAADHFDRAAKALALASQPRKPLEPMLPAGQKLARLSPQPDRLVAVRAAASPLFEAARPLLESLARIPLRLDMAQAQTLHRRWMDEIPLFQSISQDAGIRREYTLGASYALCTALDEALGSALFAGRAQATDPAPSMPDSLAVHFHADHRGGDKIFMLVAWLVREPKMHIDLLELIFAIMRLGFEGTYRHASNGRRELDNTLYRLHSMVSTCRREGPAELADHWRQVEAFLARPR